MKYEDKFRRWLSILLALVLVLQYVPATAFAAEGDPVCDCGTDDPAIHATTCAVYVAPENPQCFCAEKCSDTNEWCDVCGFDYTACTGTDTAVAYAEGDVVSVTIDGETTYYTSIIDAVAKANESGNATITLLQDTTTKERLDITTSATLDLNGNTLSCATYFADDYETMVAVTTNGAKLTIIDSVGGGKLDGTGTTFVLLLGRPGTVGFTITSSAHISGGTVSGAVRMVEGTSMTVSGGTVERNEAASTIQIYTNATLDVSGGQILNTFSSSSAYAISNGGTLNITGGTVSGSIGVNNRGTANISGNTNITGTDCSVKSWVESQDSTLTITGGNYTGGINITGGTATISGGSYTGGIVVTGGTATISDGTITESSAENAVEVSGSAELTISGGTFSATAGGTWDTGVYVHDGGTVKITGGTITSTAYGVYNEGGSATITGGSISGETVDLYVGGSDSILNLTLDEGKTEGATFPGGITAEGTTLAELLATETVTYWGVVDGKNTMLLESGEYVYEGSAITDKSDITIRAICDHKDVKLDYITTETTHTPVCSVCNWTGEATEHTGGTATCQDPAVCEACGVSYGDKDANIHTPTEGTIFTDNGDGTHSYTCACGAAVAEVPHTLDVTTGKCVCGADMTAIATVTDGSTTLYASNVDTLNQAVTAILETGSSTFTVELPADAEAGMITAIRRAICDTDGVADGSIYLTLKGVTTIPGTTSWDAVAFGPRNAQWDENNVEIVSHEEVTQLASINLPDVTEIGAQAFYLCSNLTSITAPKVQSIGDWGFCETAITSIDMPLLKEAGYAAFYGTALTEVSLPSLETAGSALFMDCKQLRTVDLPKLQNLKNQLFDRCTSLVSVNVPAATSMSNEVFRDCSELVSITLSGVTELTYGGFAGCTKLENITLGSVITKVNANLFDGEALSSGITLTLNCGQKNAETLPAAAGTNVEWAGFTWKEVKFAHSYVDGKCTACGEDCAHTGGTATCTTLAVCDTCGVSYGEVDTTNHDSSVECENGFCKNGCYEPATLVTNENYESFYLKADYVGYYAISNAGQLFWFAQQVNVKGNREIKGILTADIDLENKPWTPIGSTGEENNNFRGVFDGQNYIIRGLNVEGGRAGLGFFGEVRTGTVKNFTIFGNVVVNTEVDYVGGVIGSICGLNGENDLERNGAIIQNITSFVNVTAKAHGIGMIGGFVGYANHQSLIEKCAWYGTFDAGEYRVDSGAGGFIGKIQEYTSEVTIRNCGAYGTIKTNYAGDYNNTATIYMGGFLSFSNTGAKTTLENCLFAGRFERGANLTDEARLGAFGTLRSVNAIKNCYYLGDDGLAAVHSDSDLKPGDNIEITSVTGEDLRGEMLAVWNMLGEYWMQGIHYPILKEGQGQTWHGDSATYTYTDNGDGTHKKTCNECGYVEEVKEEHYVDPTTTYTDNGDGTHSFKCAKCDAVMDSEPHTIENHVCTDCGAMEIVVSFNAGDYKWETGDQINFAREVEGICIDYCVFTATVAEDGTVTWSADKPFCWYGEGEQKLFAAPNNGWSIDYFVVPEDQSTVAKLDEADLVNGMWVGTPTTDTITFNMTHRMAKVTVNYEFAEGVTADISELKVYSIAQICLFSLDDWSIKLTSAGEADVWVTPYIDGNQFTAFIIPETYATGEDFIKITLSDGTVREVKMNKDVTFADGAEYTYKVVITADGAYLTCADECSFEYTANEDGLTHSKTCSKCGYVAASENHTLTYTTNGNTITAACSANCGYSETATISAEDTTYNGTEQKTATVAYSGWTGGELTVTYENNVNAGTATASITIGEATATVDFTIAKATVTVTAHAQSKTYGTENPELTYTVSGLFGSDTLTGALATTATKTSNVGEYDITVGSLANSNYTIDFVGAKLTITRAAAPEIQWPTAAALTYGQKLSDSALTSEDENGTFAWQDGSIVPTVKNNGYVVVYTPKDTDNYDYTVVELTETIPVTVSKGQATVTAAPTPNTLAYTGEAQYLISAGEAVGGEMQYSTDNQTWSTTIPQGTDAGKYTVYYKVIGDENHSDTAVDSIEVTIAKAQAVITVDTTTITVTYSETVKLPTATTNFGTVVCDKTADDLVNAGNYTVTYTVAGADNYEGAEKKLTVTVEKKAVAEPTVTGTYTYNSEEQPVVLTGVESCMTVASGNKGVGAGNYEVEITLDSNHKWAEGSDGKVQWSIAKAKAQIVVNTDPITVSYGETVKLPVARTNFGTAVCDKTAADLVNAGTYTVTYSVEGTDNYEGDTKTLTVTVGQKEVVEPTVTGTYTYTGSEQMATLTGVESYMTVVSGNKGVGAGNYEVEITLDSNHKWAEGSDGKVQWSIAKAKAQIVVNTDPITVTYGETVKLPTATTNFGTVVCDKTAADLVNAGTYTVTYTVVGTDNYDGDTKTVTVTINPKTITGADVELVGTLTYTGKEQTQEITVTEGVAYTVTGNKATAVGDYELTVTASGNYTGSVTKQWSIGKVAAVIAKVPNANTLTYSGEAQTLVTAGTSNDGKVVYSLSENGDFTETIPVGTNAGEYTVWYYVKGDDNHSDSAKASVKGVTIAKADPVIGTVGCEMPLFDSTAASAVELTRTDKTVDGTLILTDSKLTAGEGTYNWKFTPKDTDNYNTITGTVVLNVTADVLEKIEASGNLEKDSYSYGDTFSINGLTVTATYTTGATKDVTELVSFDSTLAAGQTSVVLTYQGKTCEVTGITVAKKQLVIDGISWGVPTNAVYNGTEYTATLNGTLPTGVEATLSGDKAANAGSYTAKAVFSLADGYSADNYEIVNGADLTADWTIARKNIADAEITLGTALTYNGKQQTQTVASVKIDGLTVTCTVSGNTGTDAKGYTLTVTGTDNFEGTATADWSIAKKNISGAAITLGDSLTYNGNEQTQEVTEVKIGDLTVTYDVTANKQLGADDYTLTITGNGNFEGSATADWSIAKAKLTITANNNSITYGDVPAANGVTGIGFVSSESIEDLSGKLTYSYNYEQFGNVGTYKITPSGVTSGNYEITFADGTLTVNAKAITVTADVVTKTYGEADPVLTYKVEGLVNSDELTGELKRAAGENVGSYDIEQNTLTAGGNYTITYTGAKLNINAKVINAADVKLNGSLAYNGKEQTQPITVTEGITYEVSGNKAIDVGTYDLTVKGTGNYTGEVKLSWSIKAAVAVVGTAPTAKTLTYTGEEQTLVNAGATADGKLVYSLTENGEYTEDIPTGTNAGEYTVWYYVVGDDNHSDSVKDSVTVSIAKAQAVITVDTTPIRVVYGETAKLPTATTNFGTVVCDKTAADLVNAGTYTVTYSVEGTDNYEGDTKTLTVTVGQKEAAEPTVTGTYTYTGSEQMATLTGVESYMTVVSGNQGTNAGNYEVEITLDSNHKWAEGSDGKVQWSIAKAKAQIVVNTDPITVTYGETVKLPTATTNFGTVVCDKTAADLVNAGTYTVTYSVEGTDNYEGDTKTLTVTVGQKEAAEPTVTGTYTYTGSEQMATLTGVESYMTVASGNQGTNAGNYEVEITLDSNHKWAEGSDGKVQWIIAKAKTQIVVNTDPITVSYGETVKLPTATTNFGTVVCDKTAADLVNAGTYTGTYTVVGTDNYDGDTKTVTVTINPKTITVNADAVSKTYGDADPVLTFKVEGLVTGDKLTGELKRVAGENVGSYEIEQNTLTAGGNYCLDYTGAKLVISKRNVSITAKDQTITYGGPIANAEITSVGLVKGHDVTVTLMPSTANVTMDGTITASGAVITADGTDVTNNYNVSYISGKLVIEPDTSEIDALTTENVTSANEADVKAVQEMMANADSVKDEWTAINATCEELIHKIEAVEAENSRIADAVAQFDLTSVKASDEAAITQLVSDIDGQLAAGNLTDEEKAELEGLKTKCSNLIAKIDGTETLIGQLDQVVSDLDADTVKSTDKADLEQVIADAQTLIDSGNVTEIEKEALEQTKKDAQALIDVIEKTQKDTATENTQKVEGVTSENVKSEDKAALEAASEDLKQALESNAGNYTEEERKEIQDQIQRIESAIESVEKAEKVDEIIANLSDQLLNGADEDQKALQHAKDAYDALTDHEKSLVDADSKKKLDALVEQLQTCDGGHSCPSNTFTDLDAKAWYHEYTDYVISHDYMNGYPSGSFGPGDQLSRAMLVQILYNLENRPAVSGADEFTDTDSDDWYADAVLWATQNEIIMGYGNGKFGPSDPVTREQMVTIFYRYAQAKGYDLAEGSFDSFPDGEKVSKFARTAMRWAVGNRLIVGMTDGTLCPGSYSIRAEVATILYRFIIMFAK